MTQCNTFAHPEFVSSKENCWVLPASRTVSCIPIPSQTSLISTTCLPEGGREESKEKGSCPLFTVDLNLGKYFGHMNQMFLPYVGFLFPWEENPKSGSFCRCYFTKIFKNRGEKFYVSWLWFSQLLARNTTKSCPVSCICGLSLQASVMFASCTSKAILFFKDQS